MDSIKPLFALSPIGVIRVVSPKSGACLLMRDLNNGIWQTDSANIVIPESAGAKRANQVLVR